MRRVIVIAVLIIISFVLQTTLFNYHDVVGVAPDLLLVITMSFGIMRGRREGLLTGFFCGLLYDVFYGTLLGPFMFLYMVIGYVNVFFHRNYLKAAKQSGNYQKYSGKPRSLHLLSLLMIL